MLVLLDEELPNDREILPKQPTLIALSAVPQAPEGMLSKAYLCRLLVYIDPRTATVHSGRRKFSVVGIVEREAYSQEDQGYKVLSGVQQ